MLLNASHAPYFQALRLMALDTFGTNQQRTNALISALYNHFRKKIGNTFSFCTLPRESKI